MANKLQERRGAGNTRFYVYGTWALNGTNLTFSVAETSTSHTQSGNAVYNSTSGNLTDAAAGVQRFLD